MEEIEKSNIYSTETHNEELDFIFNQEPEDLDNVIFENKDILHELKMYLRLIRKNITLFAKQQKQKSFSNILYITLDCPPFTTNSNRQDNPLEYISEMRKQYPDKNIQVLIPIINLDKDFRPNKKLTVEIDGRVKTLEKTNIIFKFFLQNRVQGAIVYKFPKENSNIQVYGIYSPAFSWIKNISELSKLQYLAPFLKATRIAVKRFGQINFPIDIVHCESIPYYLGAEFESKMPSRIKVLQAIKDFTQIDIAKPEAFWAVLNLADKKAMSKICRDNVIKKCVANLFNLHNTQRFYQMKDCLKFIYKNYYKFRKYIDKGEDVDENFIFNRLNARIMQLFPQIAYGEDLYFNPMMYTLKKCDFWTTISETYYKQILANPKLSGKMFKQIEKTETKSDFTTIACDLNNFPKTKTRNIYQCFTVDNFREFRKKNKEILIKEFNKDRIKTKFVDPTLFSDENVQIVGSLDSFYEAPLFFANPSSDIFANGIDILFNTVLKLFELHKNFQIIICIKDGLKNNFIKNWIEYLDKNKYFNGRWIFIDAKINPQKFFASTDATLIPRRANITSTNHFIAMNYGCIPIVARSGILNDTIPDIFDNISEGCGFKTKTDLLTEEDNNELFLTPVMKALNLYHNNPNSWNLLIKNCLLHNSGWSFEILEKYNRIYQNLL